VLIGRWLGSLVNRAVLLVVGVVVLTALLVALAGTLLSRSELEQQAANQVTTIAQLVAGERDGFSGAGESIDAPPDRIAALV